MRQIIELAIIMRVRGVNVIIQELEMLIYSSNLMRRIVLIFHFQMKCNYPAIHRADCE